MGIITTVAGPELRQRIYNEGAALPYRGMSVLSESPWDDEGLSFMEILTDRVPPGKYGHYDSIIDGDRIRFKKDCDV